MRREAPWASRLFLRASRDGSAMAPTPSHVGASHSHAPPLASGGSALSKDGLVLLLIAATALLLRLAGPSWTAIAYVILALYTLRGDREVIQALGLSWLLTMLNSPVATEATGASLGRFFVIASACASLLCRRCMNRDARRPNTVGMASLALGTIVIGHSLLVSPMPSVSLLKAMLWTLTVVSLSSAWSAFALRDRARMEGQLFGGLALLLTFSVPLLASSLGYMRNETGFQGVLNHPQAFGATMALLGGWLAGTILASSKPTFGRFVVLAAVVIAIVLSEARTALLSLALGVPMGVLFAAADRRRPLKSVMPALWSGRTHLAAAAVLAVLLVAGASVAGVLSTYLQKRSNAGTASEMFEASRGSLVSRMWANIKRTPVQGIGFGIASDPSSMAVSTDPWFGLPSGAPVEKGVMPVAVLEELGIFGAIAVGAWLIMIIHRAAQNGVKQAVLVCTALATNMGEATLFSAGGMGMMILVTVTWAASRANNE